MRIGFPTKVTIVLLILPDFKLNKLNLTFDLIAVGHRLIFIDRRADEDLILRIRRKDGINQIR
jgi:hypothetical protein